ncbi:ImmA/IrrE family metallo-endopeptidase, partial [Fusobacterium watanabei]
NFFATHLLKDFIPFHQDEIADFEIVEELEKYLDM